MEEKLTEKLGFKLKEETLKRCHVFALDEKQQKRFRTISSEQLGLLFDAPKSDFSIFFRIEEIMIEFIKPEEFSPQLLKQLQGALQKSQKRMEICVLKSEHPRFINALNELRTGRMRKLRELDEGLDPKVLETFANLSSASQLVVRGGITNEVVSEVTNSASQMVSTLMNSNSAVATLSRMVIHDPTLYDHSASVAMLASAIALKCLPKPLSQEEASVVARCGLYHDVGKTCVPSAILNKPGKFTPEEYEVMKTHTDLGYEELMRTIAAGAPIEEIAARVALEHHERFTGRGYPKGKSGRFEDDQENGIHLYTRIVTIADVYSALLMKRVYKPAYEAQDAIKVMAEIAGDDYDPDIFPRFLRSVVNSLNDYQKTVAESGAGRILVIDDSGKLTEHKKKNQAS